MNYSIESSFQFTYYALLFGMCITLIGILVTRVKKVRQIMVLEFLVLSTAFYFYRYLVEYSKEEKIDWTILTRTRYEDWSCSTPIMLMTLCYVLSKSTGINVSYMFLTGLWLADTAMLYAGYLGEIGVIERWIACLIGFVFFFLIFFYIYKTFLRPRYVLSNYVIYSFYFIVWALYGVVYFLDHMEKNVILNLLDVIAKPFVSILLFVFYFDEIVTYRE